MSPSSGLPRSGKAVIEGTTRQARNGLTPYRFFLDAAGVSRNHHPGMCRPSLSVRAKLDRRGNGDPHLRFLLQLNKRPDPRAIIERVNGFTADVKVREAQALAMVSRLPHAILNGAQDVNDWKPATAAMFKDVESIDSVDDETILIEEEGEGGIQAQAKAGLACVMLSPTRLDSFKYGVSLAALKFVSMLLTGPNHFYPRTTFGDVGHTACIPFLKRIDFEYRYTDAVHGADAAAERSIVPRRSHFVHGRC